MKKIAFLVAAALSSPFALAADAPSYSFVEVGYTSYDLDELGDATGFKLAGSAALGENFFVMADMNSTSGDYQGFDYDFDKTGYGFGIKSDTASGNSWFASYSFNTFDVEGEDFDIDTLRLGLRSQVSDTFELSVSLTSNDVEGEERENGYQFGAVYSFSDSVKFTFDYDTIAGDVDMTNTSFNVRWTF